MYSFCSAYELKIEQIVISHNIDIIWKLYAYCSSGSRPWLHC